MTPGGTVNRGSSGVLVIGFASGSARDLGTLGFGAMAQETCEPAGVGGLLEAVFAGSPEPIAVWKHTTLQFVNAAFVCLFGYESAAEMVGRPALDFIAPSAHPAWGEFVRRRSMGEDVPLVYSVRGLRRDGSEFPVEVRSTTLASGGEELVLTMVRAAKSDDSPVGGLRAEESFYRAIFDVNPAVKLLIAPETGQIVDANRAAMEFYGWSVEELRTMRISDINVLSAAEIAEEMANAVSGRRRYFRFRHRTRARGIRHVEVHSGPAEIAGRTLLLSIIHDVTERDVFEARLREAEKLESIGRLAGGVAHDFNNLLTVMLGSAEIIAREYPPGSNAQPHLADLRHAALRAAALTRDLLAFGRRQLLVPTRFDLNDAVRRMSSLLGRAFGPSIRVVLELSDELPPVSVDASNIERVIMNLALNARDAMPHGGTLVFRTESSDDEAGISSPRAYVVLRVIDDGCGMDEATQRRLFEPFFTTKEQGRGTGLGLSTAHGVVVQSGGQIRVRSVLGEGSEFTVLLPRADANEPEALPPMSEARSSSRARVLLVDDLPAVRHVMALGLRHSGFDVIEAASADEAEAVFRASSAAFDALVTDVVMPGRSGIELAHALRALAPHLVVLFASGDARVYDATLLPRDARFLQKPFTADRIVQLLFEMLPRTVADPEPLRRTSENS